MFRLTTPEIIVERLQCSLPYAEKMYNSHDNERDLLITLNAKIEEKNKRKGLIEYGI